MKFHNFFKNLKINHSPFNIFRKLIESRSLDRQFKNEDQMNECVLSEKYSLIRMNKIKLTLTKNLK